MESKDARDWINREAIQAKILIDRSQEDMAAYIADGHTEYGAQWARADYALKRAEVHAALHIGNQLDRIATALESR